VGLLLSLKGRVEGGRVQCYIHVTATPKLEPYINFVLLVTSIVHVFVFVVYILYEEKVASTNKYIEMSTLE